MKNSKQGFAPLILIIIIVAVSILGYVIYRSTQNKSQLTQFNKITVTKVEKDLSQFKNYKNKDTAQFSALTFPLSTSTNITLTFVPIKSCFRVGSVCKDSLFTLNSNNGQKDILKLLLDQGGGNVPAVIYSYDSTNKTRLYQNYFIDNKGNLYLSISGQQTETFGWKLDVFDSSGFKGVINTEAFGPDYTGSPTMFSDSTGTYIITGLDVLVYDNNTKSYYNPPVEVFKVNI